MSKEINELHFLLDEKGVLKVMKDIPEKPWTTNYPFKGFPKWAPSHSEIEKYELALQKAKDNALEVENKEDVFFAVGLIFQVDQIYPLEGCKMEVKVYCAYDACTTYGQCYHCREPKQLALITFPSKEVTHSQEEIWSEAQADISHKLGTYSNDLVCDLARWSIEALKEKYNLTRK